MDFWCSKCNLEYSTFYDHADVSGSCKNCGVELNGSIAEQQLPSFIPKEKESDSMNESMKETTKPLEELIELEVEKDFKGIYEPEATVESSYSFESSIATPSNEEKPLTLSIKLQNGN